MCKVSDFGLLRELPKGDALYQSQSDYPWPIRWMAPESLGDRLFSQASDVWSFGVLQWEMFNPTELPYKALKTNQQVSDYVLQENKTNKQTKKKQIKKPNSYVSNTQHNLPTYLKYISCSLLVNNYPKLYTTQQQVAMKIAEGYRIPTPRGCLPIVAKMMKACWHKVPEKRPSFLYISTLLTKNLM